MRRAIPDLGPGKTVELADGVHELKDAIQIEGKRGTAEAPVVIRAANRGQAILRGHAGLVLKDCEYCIVEGLVFENDANQRAVLLENCRHVRITRCRFRLNESKKPKSAQFWVYVIGDRSGHNRVDHNLFEQQKNRGSMLFIRGDDKALAPSQHDQVDHNHFRDVIDAAGANGHETLRTGSNDLGAAGRSTFTVIERNLFERCSGEQEIISLKSSGNVVRQNCFIDCRGSICLRLGNRSTISGNVMSNPGRVAGAGGVKIYGFEHRVEGNHFHDLTGTSHLAPLALIPGSIATESTDQIGERYRDLTSAPATRVKILGNTWVDCAPLDFGSSKEDKARPFIPNHCVFTGNRIIQTKRLESPLIRLGLIRDFEARDNVAQPVPSEKSPWSAWFSREAASAGGSREPVDQLAPTQVGPDAP